MVSNNNTHIQDTANAIKNLIEPYILNLTSDNEFIPSGSDCNLTVTLTDLDLNPVAGELLWYKIIDSMGDALVEGTIFTDEYGTAEFNYMDEGAGDVTVHVWGRMFLHETCEIHVD